MASAQVVKTSVNTNTPSQYYTTNPDDHSVLIVVFMPTNATVFLYPLILPPNWQKRPSSWRKLIRDGPVDLVGGGGGGGGRGVEEFVKIKFAEPQKGIKKNLHTQHCEKKLQSKTSNVVIVQSILFE